MVFFHGLITNIRSCYRILRSFTTNTLKESTLSQQTTDKTKDPYVRKIAIRKPQDDNVNIDIQHLTRDYQRIIKRIINLHLLPSACSGLPIFHHRRPFKTSSFRLHVNLVSNIHASFQPFHSFFHPSSHPPLPPPPPLPLPQIPIPKSIKSKKKVGMRNRHLPGLERTSLIAR
ncbi:hypothetical protein EYC84_003796 [Monilinia fructicola]|uniref:Uncharacterized protein n=1 Tax=Monilinia fructicola TaxID=38448 RepID=A0A5M9JUX1_MONFR|nr:hypothetical protein EYC84_003796 [Monilinia fructicola]